MGSEMPVWWKCNLLFIFFQSQLDDMCEQAQDNNNNNSDSVI